MFDLTASLRRREVIVYFLSLIWSVPEKLIYGSSSLLDLSEMDDLVSARIGIWH